ELRETPLQSRKKVLHGFGRRKFVPAKGFNKTCEPGVVVNAAAFAFQNILLPLNRAQHALLEEGLALLVCWARAASAGVGSNRPSSVLIGLSLVKGALGRILCVSRRLFEPLLGALEILSPLIGPCHCYARGFAPPVLRRRTSDLF